MFHSGSVSVSYIVGLASTSATADKECTKNFHSTGCFLALPGRPLTGHFCDVLVDVFEPQLKLCTPCKPFKFSGKPQPLPTSFRKSHNGMRRYTALKTGLSAFSGLLWAFCLIVVVAAVIASCSLFHQCNGEPSGQHQRRLRQGQAACGENAYHKHLHEYAYPPSGGFSVGAIRPPGVIVLIQRTKTTKRALEATTPLDALNVERISLTTFATHRRTHRSSVEKEDRVTLPKLAPSPPLCAWGGILLYKGRGYQSPRLQAQLAFDTDRVCSPPFAAGVGIFG
jgi:hypothetical protein